jgi:Zn finger protein HypA/HybF involved in hydrogenase expression
MKMLKRIFVACAFLLALATYAQENQPTATMQSTQTQATQQMQSTAQPQAQTAQTNAQAQTNQTTQTATQSAEQQNPQGVIQTVVEETEVSVEGVAVQCTCPNCKKVCPQDKASCPKAKSCTPCDKAKKVSKKMLSKRRISTKGLP